MAVVSEGLELQIIHFCAPVLAGIKSGGMFSITRSEYPYLVREIRTLNTKLNATGLYFFTLCRCMAHELLFVYNRSRVADILQNQEVQQYLRVKGYVKPFTVEHSLFSFKSRFVLKKTFPHEVGIFLGYPLEDVQGFEANGGKNYKCCGCWKVYGNVLKAHHCFCSYADCTRCMLHEYATGKKDFEQLCHAA